MIVIQLLADLSRAEQATNRLAKAAGRGVDKEQVSEIGLQPGLPLVVVCR
jgi:hypothetical protein